MNESVRFFSEVLNLLFANFALFTVAICLKTMSSHYTYLSPQCTQRAQSGHMICNKYYVLDYNIYKFQHINLIFPLAYR